MRRDGRADWLVAVASLALFAATVCPTVPFGDGGELIAAAACLGVAHPPGYPLYTLLGWLALQIPLGEPALRMNVLSALFGAIACAVAARIARRWSGSSLAAAVAGLGLAVSGTFWSIATVAEVYTLHLALVATLLLWASRVGVDSDTASRSRAIVLAGLALGLGLLMEGLEKATVRRTIDDARADDPAFGLGSGLRITLRGAAETRQLTLGAQAAEGLRYALRDDRKTVLLVEAAPLAALPLEPGALADARLTRVNRYQVTRFAYETAAGRLVAVREGKDRWRTESGAPLSADAIYALLVKLLDAPVAGFETGGRSGREPEATLEFEVEGGGKDRIEYDSGGKARVASLSDVVYRLDAPPPPVPDLR